MGHSNSRWAIKIYLLFIILTIFLGVNVCFADNLKDAFLKGGPLDQVAGDEGAGYKLDATAEGMIGLVITTALTFVGVIFLVLAIYGGYIWMIARGNEQEVERAKKIIEGAIIGLVVVVGAYAISWYIIYVIGGVALKSATP